MAQLDNAADSDSEERGFKSLWAGQKRYHTFVWYLFYFYTKRDLNQKWKRTPSKARKGATEKQSSGLF